MILNFYFSTPYRDRVPRASEAKTQRQRAIVENHRKVLSLLKGYGISETHRLGYIEAALLLAKLNRTRL